MPVEPPRRLDASLVPPWVTARGPCTTTPTFIPNTGNSTITSKASVPPTVAGLSTPTLEVPIKGGRGRPRTRPLTPPLPGGVDPPPKRGRGRPRKDPFLEGEDPPPKRPRGRPPKVRGPDEISKGTENNPLTSQPNKGTITGAPSSLEEPLFDVAFSQNYLRSNSSSLLKSYPVDAAPPPKGHAFGLGPPLRYNVLKPSRQSKRELRENPIKWNDWTVDEDEDVDPFEYPLGQRNEDDNKMSRADSFIELPKLSSPLQLPRVPPASYPGTNPSPTSPLLFEGLCPTRTAKIAGKNMKHIGTMSQADAHTVDIISPFGVLKFPEEAVDGAYWSQMILSGINSQLQSEDTLLRDLDEQSFNMTDIIFWAIKYAKSTEGMSRLLKNCQEDILEGSEMWWKTHSSESTPLLHWGLLFYHLPSSGRLQGGSL